MDIWDLLFPKNCLGCKKLGKYLCQTCLDYCDKSWLICPICKKRSPIGQTHDSCKSKYSLDGLITLYKYTGVIKVCISSLKYKFVTGLGNELANICVNSLVNLQVQNAPVIVPIPLYRVRKNRRGFNQSEVIAKYICLNLGFILETNILIRTKHQKAQVGLTNEERVRNICGEFAVNTQYLASNETLKNKTIYLFDDVWTTGSTLKEACIELKKAGFNNVWGITIC